MTKRIDDQRVYGDSKLTLKYEILNKLGEGCFGTLYRAINRTTKKQIALKIEYFEESNHKRSNMANQITILEKLKGVQGVPKLFGAGKWAYGYFMQIQLLSSSLHDQRNREYSQAQIYVMVRQLFLILKQMHAKGVIHQDLKPQNIMRNTQGSLFIIDFGLSTILSSQNQAANHKKRGFIGTPRYASIAAHEGHPQKAKDDIESLLYVIGSMYVQKVPWFQLKCPASKRLQKIQKYKQIGASSWFKQCGQSFSIAYQYLRELQPNSNVDYDYLISLFNNSRKTLAHKTQKFQSVNIQATRRKSDADKLSKFPTINIHFVDHVNNNQQTKTKTISFKDENSEISRSHTNFSQLAQDGYMELLQLLTEKIFKNIQDNQETQDSAHVNSIYNSQPHINNIKKYQGLHFKNPFQV